MDKTLGDHVPMDAPTFKHSDELTCVKTKNGRWLREGHGLGRNAECELKH